MKIFEKLRIDKSNLKVIELGEWSFAPLEFRNKYDLNIQTFGSLVSNDLVEATELEGNAEVNKITVKNKSDDYLVLHDGEIIVGAKQNRTIDKSIILNSNEIQNVDVLCVEKGRWNYNSSEFSQHNAKLSPEIRYSKESTNQQNKQTTVWNEIDNIYLNSDQHSQSSDFCEFKEENNEVFLNTIKSKIFNNQYNGLFVKGPQVCFLEIFYDANIYEDQITKSIKSFLINKNKKNYQKVNIEDYLKILKNSDWNKEFINSASQSFVINDKIKGRLIFLKGQLVHLILYFHNNLHFGGTYD
jgi:hypothetical protein